MDKLRTFRIGLMLLALIIFGFAAWIFVTPPVSDDLEAWALVAIGIVMLIVGYRIQKRDQDL